MRNAYTDEMGSGLTVAQSTKPCCHRAFMRRIARYVDGKYIGSKCSTFEGERYFSCHIYVPEQEGILSVYSYGGPWYCKF